MRKPEFKLTGPADTSGLAVECRLNPQVSPKRRWESVNGDQICGVQLRAEHGESVDLPGIPTISLGAACICNACLEHDATFAEDAGLALNADQTPDIIDRQVVSCLTPGDKDRYDLAIDDVGRLI